MKKLFLFLCFSGLSFFLMAQVITGKVSDAQTGDALISVSVKVANSSQGAVTNVDGSYSLSLEPGTYDLIFSYIGYQTTRKNVTLQAGQSLALDVSLRAASTALSAVRVIGSRSTVLRSKLTSPVPVDVLSARDIVSTNQVELGQVLQFVAPSFSSNHQTVADGTDHIDPATLRGLFPDQVLVLINGKRRHTSALVNINGTIGKGAVSTDLNAIPSAAIDRIEVLRDGAAAQYGSDAIAGVINIVLKSGSSEGSLSAHIGQHMGSYNNGGTNEDGRGREVQFRDGQNYQISYNKGYQLGNKGFLNATFEYRKRAKANRVGRYTGRVYLYEYEYDDDNDPNTPPITLRYDAGNAVNGVPQFYTGSQTDAELVAQRGQVDLDKTMNIGQSASENLLGFFNGGIKISDNTNLYFNMGLGFRQGQANGFFRAPGSRARTDLVLYPHGFLPAINSTIFDKSMTVGIKTKQGGWDIDISNTYGSNSFRYEITNSNNNSYPVGTSPTSAYAGTLSFRQNTTNGDISRDFGKALNLESFNVAFGGEFRIDNYQIEAGEAVSYEKHADALNLQPNSNDAPAIGIQVFPGFRPDNELDNFRYSSALYLDVETDITSGFLLSGAARYERYSDFGSNLSYKLTSRLRLGEKVSLRAAYSTGFRAPSLHQRYHNTISTLFEAGVPNETLTVQNGSTLANLIGIPNLKAEISKSLSGGLTFQLSESLGLTIDAYQINITDRIVYSGSFKTEDFLPVLQPFLDEGVTRFRFFANAIDSKTQGLDVVLSYGKSFSKGNLRATLAATFNGTRQQGAIKASQAIIARNKAETLFNRQERGLLEEGQPQNKIIFSAGYDLEKWNFNLKLTRFGEVIYRGGESDGSEDQTFSAKTVADVSVNYRLMKALNLTVGINNVFNTLPDYQKESTDQTSGGRFIFSRRVLQYGFNGRYVFASLNYNF